LEAITFLNQCFISQIFYIFTLIRLRHYLLLMPIQYPIPYIN